MYIRLTLCIWTHLRLSPAAKIGEMIYKLLFCLTILSVSAYGNQASGNSAAMKSLNKSMSHKFANVHRKRDTKLEEHIQAELAPYPVIQYAPLHYEVKKESHDDEQSNVKSKKFKSSVPLPVSTGRHVYTGHKPHYEHLEPKPLKEDDNVNQQNYRSFISGHNVEVYAETTGHYLEQDIDPFLPHQDHAQKQQKGKPAKFVYYQKIKDNIEKNTPKYIVGEEPNNFNILEYHPAGINSAKTPHKKSLPYAYSLHDLLTQEKQQQTYGHPRIHLNIARSYNVANQNVETHLPPGLAPKPLSKTNIIIRPQNTHMFPLIKKSNSVNLSFS